MVVGGLRSRLRPHSDPSPAYRMPREQGLHPRVVVVSGMWPDSTGKVRKMFHSPPTRQPGHQRIFSVLHQLFTWCKSKELQGAGPDQESQCAVLPPRSTQGSCPCLALPSPCPACLHPNPPLHCPWPNPAATSSAFWPSRLLLCMDHP